MRRLVFVLLDGVGDRPDPTLNWTTPLQSASTPNLDSLARRGVLRLVRPLGKKLSPESDIAVFGMLGYEFGSNYPGRGVVEAFGVGLPFKEGQLAIRANFATLDADGAVLDRRVGRSLTTEEARQLADLINRDAKLENASFTFVPTVEYRGVLVIEAGDRLSANITNTDPGYLRKGRMGFATSRGGRERIFPCKALDNQMASKFAARLVNEFTKKVISVLSTAELNKVRKAQGKKPANCILLRDAGDSVPKISKISEKFSKRFACIVDLPVERGIARLTGMDEYSAGGISDYREKASKCLQLVEDYDAVYVHIKGPDEPGHEGNANGKRKSIEDIDREFFGPIRERLLEDDLIVAVSADHATPCQLKAHSSDPVPLLVSAAGVGAKSNCRFTERHASITGRPLTSFEVLDWIFQKFMPS